jgi:acetamidase/formamidase
MEVEFTVDLLYEKSIGTPRVESESDSMAVGLGGSPEDAMTNGMAQWLEQDDSLTPSEIAQVMGTSVQLSISEVVDRNAGVAAKISKVAREKTVARRNSCGVSTEGKACRPAAGQDIRHG